MGVVYLAYCGSWQLSLHVPCFCAFYIFNTIPNPTSSSFFQNVFVLVFIMLDNNKSHMAILKTTPVAGLLHILLFSDLTVDVKFKKPLPPVAAVEYIIVVQCHSGWMGSGQQCSTTSS